MTRDEPDSTPTGLSVSQQVWNLLPAFRLVAESEHLPSAAKVLGLSPSSVSRAIRKLERVLGQPLFERHGRRLVLNDAGGQFLGRVRAAIGVAETGLLRDGRLGHAREIRIGVSPLIGRLFAFGIAEEVRAADSDVVVSVNTLDSNEDPTLAVAEREVDLVLSPSCLDHARVHSSLLGVVPRTAFVATGHPLAAGHAVGLDEVASYPFAGYGGDGWPGDAPRNVVLRSDGLDTLVAACLTGRYVVVLPDLVARDLRLHGLGVAAFEPLPVYAAQHQSAGDRVELRRITNMVRARLGQPRPAAG